VRTTTVNYSGKRPERGLRNEDHFLPFSHSRVAARISEVGGAAYIANTVSAMLLSCVIRREFVPAQTAPDMSSGVPPN
jgi:hypothetical protein